MARSTRPCSGSWPSGRGASAPSTASARPSGRGCTSTGRRPSSPPCGPSSPHSIPTGSSTRTCCCSPALLEEAPLGVVGHVGQGGVVGGDGVVVPAEPPEQLGAGGVEQVV